MSFLYAWAIGLGLAAAVPFILHLRRRDTDRRVSFPALRYLSRAEDARSRSLVASDVLLLATRIGLLAAVALAAAGPLLGRGGAGDHEPTDLAIVLDNTASTGRFVDDRSLFETLAERARSALEAAGPEDRVWLFSTGGGAVAAGVSPARAAEALSRVAPGDGGAALDEAVATAAAALPADPGRRREIQLLSDLQASAFVAGGAASDGVPLVAYVPPEPLEANAAIESVELTGGTTVPSGIGHGVLVQTIRAGPGGPAAADRADADGSDTVAGDDAAVRLQLDGRLAGAARAPWGGIASIGLPELGVGAHRGRVEVTPGGARADDVRHFALEVVPPPGVRFIGPDTSFVRIGIETLRDAGRLGGDPASVTVVDGTAGAVSTVLGALDAAATLVMIPPADPVDLPAFNQLLAGLEVPWSARPDSARGSLDLRPAPAAFSLSGIRVHRRYLLRAGTSIAGRPDTTILATADGEPWLVRTAGGDRTVLLLASPLVPDATDLPTHPVVLPFLEALLVRWSHLSSWPPGGFVAGEALQLPPWGRTVTEPNGRTRTVEGGGRYTPSRTGLYRLEGTDPGGDARSADFAVNVPAAEMDPTPLADGALEELFPGRPVFTGGPEEGGWRDGIFRARRGRDAAPWLIGIALVLAAVELFLATSGVGRRGGLRAWGRRRGGAEAPRAGAEARAGTEARASAGARAGAGARTESR